MRRAWIGRGIKETASITEDWPRILIYLRMEGISGKRWIIWLWGFFGRVSAGFGEGVFLDLFQPGKMATIMSYNLILGIQQFWPACLVLSALLLFVMWIGILFGKMVQYNQDRQNMYINECRKCKRIQGD